MSDNVVTVEVQGKDLATPAMESAARSSSNLGDKLMGLAGPLAAAAAGFGAMATLKGAVDATDQLGDSVHKLSMDTGMSVEASSQMVFMLQHIGLTADDADRAFGIFSKNLVNGTKTAVDTMNTLGVSFKDANGNMIPLDQTIAKVADKFATMSDGPTKTAYAMDLFGRSGKDMIPLLDMGSAGMAKLAKEADNLGLTLTGSNVESIHNYTLAHRDMEAAVEGIRVKIGLALMPVLTNLSTWFTNHQKDIIDFGVKIKDYLIAPITAAIGVLQDLGGRAFFDRLNAEGGAAKNIFLSIATAAGVFAVALTAIGITSFIAATAAFVAGLWEAIQVIGVLDAVTLASPLAAFVLLGLAVAAVDLTMRATMGNGLIDWFGKLFDRTTDAERALNSLGTAQDRVNALEREGATAAQASVLLQQEIINQIGNEIVAMEKKAAAAEADHQALSNNWNGEKDYHKELGQFIDGEVKRIKDLGLNYQDLQKMADSSIGALLMQNKDFVKALGDAKSAHDATGTAAAGQAEKENALVTAYNDLEAAVKKVNEVFAIKTPAEADAIARAAALQVEIDGYNRYGVVAPKARLDAKAAADEEVKSMDHVRTANDAMVASIASRFPAGVEIVTGLGTALAKLPAQTTLDILTRLNSEGIDQAFRDIADLKNFGTIDVNIAEHWAGVVRNAMGGFITARAGGGMGFGRTLVGELGPEIVDLPIGSRVYSNAESRQMAGQGQPAGNATHNYYIQTVQLVGDPGAGLAALGGAV